MFDMFDIFDIFDIFDLGKYPSNSIVSICLVVSKKNLILSFLPPSCWRLDV